MTAQRRGLIVLAEDPSALQFGHQLVDDMLQPGRKDVEVEVEAVGRALGEPLPNRVGYLLWCADQRPLCVRAALKELADGESLPPGHVQDGLGAPDAPRAPFRPVDVVPGRCGVQS